MNENESLITRLNKQNRIMANMLKQNRIEFSDLRNMLGAIAAEQIKLSKHLGLERNSKKSDEILGLETHE